MAVQGIKPNTITYNTLIDAYGRSKRFTEMESTLVQVLRLQECEPDAWSINYTFQAFGGSIFEARKRRNGTKCGGKKNQTEKKLASEKAPAEKKSKAGKKLTQESGATVGGKRKKQ
ncbi:pentatricopeptide repeat-containing [Olea europaea subsp. europaea]|uniref:Pentatricopeptide repeat-containing, partial n=1 Tax=Olea europaea subsp. europaea TaxID=158383 RepID=A0A8S0T5X7_OLEEU|nr:pentatricopeptide repeat-containing [Olea europaea subsp. europaea]